MAMRARQPQWTITHPDAAAVDIGATRHFVAVPPDRDDEPVREFGCHTADLQALADWLCGCGVTTVALEATGVYWIPAYEVLEARGLDVWLVNARGVRHVSGRKSDVLDCQWLQQLHTFGLLRRAFRPDAAVCALREIVRVREKALAGRARHVQRMQKALTQMNVQLMSVLTDIAGETGLAIIRAIVAGERNPAVLAALRNYRVHASAQEIERSLQGTWKHEHVFCLTLELAGYDFGSEQLKKIDAEIEMLLRALAVHDKTPQPNAKKARAKNAPSFDIRRLLLNWSGVDLTAVPGIDATTAMKVLSEIGASMQRFETAKHFCSWLGLCPGTHISGGKRLSRATKRLPNRISRALKLAAMGLSRSQCAMGGYFRRMTLRMGSAQAITAVAHKLARTIYAMLTKQVEYVEQEQSMHEQRYAAGVVKRMRQRAAQFGFELVAKPQAAAV